MMAKECWVYSGGAQNVLRLMGAWLSETSQYAKKPLDYVPWASHVVCKLYLQLFLEASLIMSVVQPSRTLGFWFLPPPKDVPC